MVYGVKTRNENVPASKLEPVHNVSGVQTKAKKIRKARSLAMGLVEVHGRAKRKYALVSPMTLVITLTWAAIA